MSTIKLIIADENQNYTKGLAEYLIEEYGQAFEVTCFTQVQILMNYLDKCEAADILLINPTLLKKANCKEHIKSIILLVENVDYSIENSIYKYQRADQIAKMLLEAYDKTSNCGVNILKSSTICKIVCVYSPAGAAGKTTIAHNLAVQYSMQGKKALFISLESYSALSIFNQSKSSKGLIYLLYLIKSKLPNLLLKLNAIITTDHNINIHFIEREKNVLEYKDIKIKDIELVTDFLRNQGDYDAVILDLDSSISEMVLGAFKYSDVIINVCCDDNISSAKQENFEQQISKINNLLELDISCKLIGVKNKSGLIINNEDLDAKECKTLLEIPYIKGACISSGAYFPEMIYFKHLYDNVENSIYK